MNDSIPEDKRGKGLGAGEVTDVDPVTGDAIPKTEVEPEGTIKLNPAGAEAMEKFIATVNGLLGFVAGIRVMCVKSHNEDSVDQIDGMLDKLGITMEVCDEEGNIKWAYKDQNVSEDEQK
jgi:hypothetical protein